MRDPMGDDIREGKSVDEGEGVRCCADRAAVKPGSCNGAKLVSESSYSFYYKSKFNIYELIIY